MSHYFFDLEDDGVLKRDDEGVECKELQDVRWAAISALAEVVREELPDGDSRKLSMCVRDVGGRYIFEAKMTFSAEWIR